MAEDTKKFLMHNLEGFVPKLIAQDIIAAVTRGSSILRLSTVQPMESDNKKDSKIVSLTGEGSFTVKSVINRNINKYLEAWKAGHDPRANIVGLLADPDAVDGQKERCTVDNVWFNELTLMQFEKASVVEKEFPFGFTPEDASFLETIGEICLAA